MIASAGLLACDRSDRPVSPSPVASLVGTEWSLMQLEGRPTGAGAGGVAPTLLFAAADSRVSGFAGCNRLMAGYRLTADRLTFTPIATTRMFCAEGMDLERRYLTALEATRAYRRTESRLELLGDAGVIARFQTPP